jgi:hypothetical protein
MFRSAVILLLCIILFTGASVKTAKQDLLLNPFDKLEYDKAIAYDYNGEANHLIVTDEGELIKIDGRHGEIFAQKVLSKKQVVTLHRITGDTSSYGGIGAACFDPHLGIVYYFKEKIVGHISICLACNYLESSMEIPASNFKIYYLADDSTELTAYGFNKAGSMKLSNFCQSLGFDHCGVNPESPFFKVK